ncbi:MAG: hypothetical protein KY458_08865, partial [Actinobacteria bacterium]|nr:hypothetical protein [Actinomycetota bacterium]
MPVDRRALLRLVAGFVLLSLVPLGLLAYTSVDVAEAAVRREVKAHLVTATRVTAGAFERRAESLADLGRSYALRPNLVAALGGATS